jgi:hypothetical protein
VSGHRTWELYPDNAGYLGRVRDGIHEFVISVDDVEKLGLPSQIELELRVFHELATNDTDVSEAEYTRVLREIEKLSESDFKKWAGGLAARLDQLLGDNWTVLLSDDW